MLIGLTQLPDKLVPEGLQTVGAAISRPGRSNSYVFPLERSAIRTGRVRAAISRPYDSIPANTAFPPC